MQNLKQVLGNNFDNLYFHAKSQVKRKKIKIKRSTSLKILGHLEAKIGGNSTGYTFMQNITLKVQNTKKSSLIHH